MRSTRRLAAVLLALILAMGAGGTWYTYPFRWSFLQHLYDHPNGAVNAAAQETPSPWDALLDCVTQRVTFDSVRLDGPADRVPGLLLLPAPRPGAEGERRWPCHLFLHGFGGAKETALLFFAGDRGQQDAATRAAVFSFDLLGHGERKMEGIDLDSLTFEQARGAIMQSVLDARRAVDCLSARDDIDPGRIHLVGYSLGAMVAAVAAAVDARFQSATLLYGGADLAELGRRSAHGAARVFHAEGAWAGWLRERELAAIDPRHFVGRIAPRPVRLVNGRQDAVVPPVCAQALHRAAREPKMIEWREGGHLPEEEIEVALDAVARRAGSGLRQLLSALRRRSVGARPEVTEAFEARTEELREGAPSMQGGASGRPERDALSAE